jgi:hypothetical protein
MNIDLLHKIFETQISETANMKEKGQDFIRRVVHLYALQLLNTGLIPLNFMDDVLSDLEAEVIEIYRKKTYGFLSLEDYRRHKFRQMNDN